MCYVGIVAGWCLYVLCRHSGRVVLMCYVGKVAGWCLCVM